MNVPRRMWAALEPLHEVYVPALAAEPFVQVGLTRPWMAYFAARAGVMGRVGPAVVTAVFYGFAPAKVARSIPQAWQFCAPERAVEARLAAVDEALAPVAPRMGAVLRRAADVALAAADRCDFGGRPLAAAHADAVVGAEPHLRLWHAATVLREHRGDGHTIALAAAELNPAECHVLQAACGNRQLTPPVTRDNVEGFRGWTPAEWDAALARLAERGLCDAAGGATTAGAELNARLEDDTDRLASSAWSGSRPEELELIASVSTRLAAARQ